MPLCNRVVCHKILHQQAADKGACEQLDCLQRNLILFFCQEIGHQQSRDKGACAQLNCLQRNLGSSNRKTRVPEWILHFLPGLVRHWTACREIWAPAIGSSRAPAWTVFLLGNLDTSNIDRQGSLFFKSTHCQKAQLSIDNSFLCAGLLPRKFGTRRPCATGLVLLLLACFWLQQASGGGQEI